MKQAILKLAVADLNAFRVVARERSITTAARLLHTSQSSLSRRLRGLEDRLQMCLLLRGSQGVELTECGRKLLRHVDTLCLHEEELIAQLRGRHPHGLHGVLRLAASSALLQGVVVPAIAPLLRENPGTLVEFAGAEGARLERLLHDGRVDVVVGGPLSSRRGIESTRIGTEARYVVEHTAQRERDDTWCELHCVDEAAERFLWATLTPSLRRCLVPDTHALVACVEAGAGRALVPAYAVRWVTDVRRVAQVLPCISECYVHHPRESRNARLVRAVVDALLTNAPDHLARDPAGIVRASAKDQSPKAEQPCSSG